jgi:hypothetical protein
MSFGMWWISCGLLRRGRRSRRRGIIYRCKHGIFAYDRYVFSKSLGTVTYMIVCGPVHQKCSITYFAFYE